MATSLLSLHTVCLRGVGTSLEPNQDSFSSVLKAKPDDPSGAECLSYVVAWNESRDS
jgi:hypothetical protein